MAFKIVIIFEIKTVVTSSQLTYPVFCFVLLGSVCYAKFSPCFSIIVYTDTSCSNYDSLSLCVHS